jgi:hypothetical protein
MRFRKLRIAFSAFFALLTALLVVLWVRSYFTTDAFHWRNQNYSFGCVSAYGEVGIGTSDAQDWVWPPHQNVFVQSSAMPNSWEPNPRHPYLSLVGFRLRNYLVAGPAAVMFEFSFPYWFVVLLSPMFAVIPWICWSTRFTLRTLLIAVTVFAVVMGFVIALSK